MDQRGRCQRLSDRRVGQWRAAEGHYRGQHDQQLCVHRPSPNTTYAFQVSAFYAEGLSWSNTQNVLTFPAAPTVTLTAPSSTQVNIAWTSATSVSTYVIDEWIDGAWQQIANVGDGISYSVTGLTPQTTYQFMVGASQCVGHDLVD